MSQLLGYARVSTLEQNAALQVDALTAAGCYGEAYVDHASGALETRPQLDRILRDLRPGDTLVVWRLDRLGRSLRHLIEVVTDLGERGIAFRSLQDGIDTTTSAGRLLFGIMASLAEFERALIRERTLAGLQAARARGRRGGRPTVMTPDKVRAARQMYDSRDYTLDAIARNLGVSRSTIITHLRGTA